MRTLSSIFTLFFLFRNLKHLFFSINTFIYGYYTGDVKYVVVWHMFVARNVIISFGLSASVVVRTQIEPTKKQMGKTYTIFTLWANKM